MLALLRITPSTAVIGIGVLRCQVPAEASSDQGRQIKVSDQGLAYMSHQDPTSRITNAVVQRTWGICMQCNPVTLSLARRPDAKSDEIASWRGMSDG